MPAAQDHWRFCLAALGEGAAFAGPETLGTHGPDPFYFYGLLPWRGRRGRNRAQELADWLHGAPPAEVFIPLARAAADLSKDPGMKGTPGAPSRWPFLKGLLFHFLLDRAVHPWVYWNSGFNAPGAPDPGASVRHARFEAALDAVGFDSAGEAGSKGDANALALAPPHRICAFRREWLSGADELFAKAFPDRYVTGMYPGAWQDMTAVLHFLWDPHRWKRGLAETLGGKNTLLRGMMRPVGEKERRGFDFRNEQREPWLDPGTGESRRDSARDLAARALGETKELTEILEGIAGGSVQAENPAFLRLLGSRNHEGCDPAAGMRYRRDSPA